jgi:hypothetical protein
LIADADGFVEALARVRKQFGQRLHLGDGLELPASLVIRLASAMSLAVNDDFGLRGFPDLALVIGHWESLGNMDSRQSKVVKPFTRRHGKASANDNVTATGRKRAAIFSRCCGAGGVFGDGMSLRAATASAG